MLRPANRQARQREGACRARLRLGLERQRQQRIAQVAVERGERPQVAEVEVEVSAVEQLADAPLEEGAARAYTVIARTHRGVLGTFL